MYDTAGIGECHVGADKHIVGDGLPEDFDAEDISDYLFGFALDIGMDKGDVVVSGDYVSEG